MEMNTTDIISLSSIGVFIASYLVGSIPFGLVFCVLTGRGDIRNYGSGNIGTTNVLRVAGKFWALLTLLCDGGKGAFAVWAAAYFLDSNAAVYFCGFCAVLGHNFPIWLKFKGGKGVATSFFTLLVIAPFLGGVALAIWVFMAIVFRYSSLAALTSFAFIPFLAYGLYNDIDLTIISVLLSGMVIVKHRQNIVRLLNKSEDKITFKRQINGKS